jgi:hypothetical protein
MLGSTKTDLVFSEQEELALIKRVKRSPSREWIDRYFDLMESLISATDLENGDPRLVTSIPGRKYSVPMSLPVSTNNRYALAMDVGHKHISSHVVVDSEYMSKVQNDYVVGIIYGTEFDRLPEDFKMAEVIYYGHFDSLVYEKTLPPFFLRLKNPEHLLMPGPLRDGWISAARAEIERSKGSPYRRAHRPIVYKAAVNREYRKTVLDKAFSGS